MDKDTRKKRKSAYEVFDWIIEKDNGLLCKICLEFGCKNQSNKEAIEHKFCKRGLDLSKVSALSFDGASNFSGVHKGVQALIRKKFCPDAIYFQCRSHLLHLAAQRAATVCKEVKRTISILGDLYKIFSQSPKRSQQLKNVQEMCNIPILKVIEPSSTRWLAYERCIERVIKILPSILITLEHIYKDSGDLSSMGGGILLSLRQKETILILNVLNHIFTLLGNLSRYFQTEDSDLSNSVLFTESTRRSLENLDSFQECVEKTDKIASTLKESEVHVDEKENIQKSVKSMLLQYVNKLCQNL
ncbi:zinc finger protein 862 [Biomphalaria pfeifferi]|uniref:Zinc finger protein 862 n=1 Tax=Biomphalaria pfeifferi TaxID=112525 RepID=A0AAD8BZR9_BIOPF|nr:zinc finger protein 862 [Biomphalaria pfeifferi]